MMGAFSSSARYISPLLGIRLPMVNATTNGPGPQATSVHQLPNLGTFNEAHKGKKEDYRVNTYKLSKGKCK